MPKAQKVPQSPPLGLEDIQARAEALWDSFTTDDELAYTKVELLVETIEYESQIKIFNESERSALRKLCHELESQQGNSGGFTFDEFLDMLRRTQPMISLQSPPASPAPASSPSDNMADRVHKLEETVEDLKDIVQQLSSRLSAETAAKEAALHAVKDLEERIEKLEAESIQTADLNRNLQSELEAAERKARENHARDSLEIERLQAREQELAETLESKEKEESAAREAALHAVKDLEERIEKLEAENIQTAHLNRNLQSELEAAERKARENHARDSTEIERLQAREQELAENLESKEKEIKKVMEVQSRAAETEGEAVEAAKRASTLEKQLKESCQRELRLQRDILEMTEKQHGESVNGAEIEKLRSQELELKTQLQSKEAEMDELRKEAEQQEQTLGGEIKKLLARKSELVDRESKLEDQVESKDVEIKELRESQRQAASEHGELVDQLESKNSEIEELRKGLTQSAASREREAELLQEGLREQITGLMARESELVCRELELRDQVESKEAEIKELRENQTLAAAAREHGIEAEEQLQETLREQIKELTARESELVCRELELKDQVESKEAEIKELRENQTLAAAAGEHGIEAEEQLQETLREQIKELTARESELVREIDSLRLENQLQAKEFCTTRAEQMVAALRADIDKLQTRQTERVTLQPRRSMLSHALWCFTGFITFLPIAFLCLALRDSFRLDDWRLHGAFVPV
ncbi:hypothetical protein HDU88_008392 [Geranomyces variabilis]|nr:hypothetical protein HDU88_008392 [Geranomyces variabilis]